jgi:hypothetical protein
MPKRSTPASDLLTIGLFAPLVIGSRLQRLGLEMLRPTPKGRREIARMTAEKPLAAAESVLATQQAFSAAMTTPWADMIRATTTFLMAAAPMPALAPVRRRVRTNARRLTGL